ncbi:MAG TPA: hypothetical protein DIS82_03805 [Exiguobacterium sp.]|uniref:hypothetical protein n=1 Tax=Exiguobacterium sp. TaxID=44751 RepID=UPI000EE0475F|nr:hypothetical protein [Exiguobacterium sp.]HCN57260.1 hypothetical protein [Exiguobacterium sp.]
MINYRILIEKWKHKDFDFRIDVVENFCEKNNLYGIDGIRSNLNYVKKIIADKKIEGNKGLLKSFFETAFTIWALDKLGKSSLADTVAKNMMVGGDFGDTSAYQSNESGNYFRNFELQLALALRLLEGGLDFNEGGEGEPDFILTSETFVIEIKAPASKLALLQDILKAVKQIELSGKMGVIVVSLDHMVARGMIQNAMDDLPEQIQDIILSVLPVDSNFNTIGVIAEWVKWDEEQQHLSTIQPIMNTQKHSNLENKEIIKKVWQALSFDDISEFPIFHREVTKKFEYEMISISNMDISTVGREFYESLWGEN